MFTTARARLIAPLLVALAFLPVGCGHPSLFEQSRVVIGVKNDQPGTSEWDSYKRTGFDIRVAYHLAKEVGVADDRHVVFNDLASDDRVQALEDGRVDLVIATFSITPERMQKIDFAGPYAVTHQGFLIRKDSPPVNTVEDLNGKTVCTWTGTTSIAALERYQVRTRVQGDAQTCIRDLENRRVDAVSTDQLILYGFAQQKEWLTVTGLTIGSPNFYGVGIGKKHRDDCRKLVRAIFDYVTSDDWHRDFAETFEGLKDRWNDFRPKEQEINSWSCRDKVAE
ncbi:glutamate ABC transporter substrate-binding protein [Nocardia bovistercoris]|uniref:Glutamate ABC transporter substrate-binding protein n=1 Tax=Nocardia bovistercoris TaxID=2785916 RepID=A0A931IDE3_9NOCA|nr:glutamate ABC transporter substrate-binding protein [Nocardia bovistercoris]MBH0777738.1 glutamate ABC transporter substrate-binding protein [Nocardia bovistercoris]